MAPQVHSQSLTALPRAPHTGAVGAVATFHGHQGLGARCSGPSEGLPPGAPAPGGLPGDQVSHATTRGSKRRAPAQPPGDCRVSLRAGTTLPGVSDLLATRSPGKPHTLRAPGGPRSQRRVSQREPPLLPVASRRRALRPATRQPAAATDCPRSRQQP